MGGILRTALTMLLVIARSCQGQQVKMTLLDRAHFESERTGGTNDYQCYLSEPDKTARVSSLRISNTSFGNNPAPSPAVYDDRRTFPIWRVIPQKKGNGAFGVFGCNATINEKPPTVVPTIRLRSDAEIVPADGSFSQTVNVNDTGISISMESTDSSQQFVWRRNGEKISGPSELKVYTIDHPIRVGDAGTYECHLNTRRDMARHALHLLIVRACPASRWGPKSCIGVCDNCYNGGVCDENNGECICPAGFMGTNCETACGDANTFGDDCEIHCTETANRPTACSGPLFCRPHPAGCRCITGYEGLKCDKQCPDGTFGASCLQTCHCASGAPCSIFNGTCSNGCAAGWTGPNCQVPDVCPVLYYGNNCTDICLCLNEGACDSTTGECSDRMCLPGYKVYGDDPACRECVGATFGGECSGQCHCSEDSCNKITGACSGQCNPQWVDMFSPHNCQTGLIDATYTKMNAGVAVPVHCSAIQGPGGNLSALNFELSRDERGRNSANISHSDSLTDVGEMKLTVTREFLVEDVNGEEELHCQLWESDDWQAVLSINISVYELPVLTTAPRETSRAGTTVTIQWDAWDETRDAGDPPVTEYVPYYRESAEPEWTPGSHVSDQEFTFTSLNPETNYSFSVAAVRDGEGGEGPRSESLHLATICAGPDVSPMDVSASIIGPNQNAANVTWELSLDDLACSTGVDHFTIYYSEAGMDETEVVVRDPEARWHVVGGLSPGVSYTFRVTLTTSGGESGISGSPSLETPGTSAGPFYLLAIIPICCIVIIAVLFFVYKRRSSGGEQESTKITAPAAAAKNRAYEVDEASDDPPLSTPDTVYEVVEKPPPIVITELETYIEKCSTGAAPAFEAQFQLLDRGKRFPREVGEREGNQKKNRFKNMIAYDHSRVILDTLEGVPDSDYYNANYIKDYEGATAFIAAQGPNKASIDDFWRMVWQDNVANVVMLTNLTEKGKVRCLQYWPDAIGKGENFGSIHVKLESTEKYADYEVRKLEIRRVGEYEIRSVVNWHFQTWPDMSTPEQPTGLIGFTRRVKAAQGLSLVPLVVHCSAGIGRSGTFIALCTLMDVLQTGENIDVFGYVEGMRQARISMVQTAEQFSFLHHCLLEVYLTGDTAIPAGDIISCSIKDNDRKLKQQFRVLAKLDKVSKATHVATPEEAEKCRFPSIVPVEKRRPFLISQGKISTNNYINACFTSSYLKCKAFIATQSPLPATVEDFWRLVFDWSCPLIVMLNDMEAADETCCQYWPDSGTGVYGHMQVELKEERDVASYHYRLFELRHAHLQKVLTVHHMQLRSWNVENTTDIVSLIRSMEKLQNDYRVNHPTVVHCMDGAGRTGVFLTVASELNRMQNEHKVDVFSSVRQLRESNHNLVLTEEDYRLCHLILKADRPEPEYGNI